MSDSKGNPITAYPWEIPSQDQVGVGGSKGLDSEMKPAANWTQLEFWDDNGKPFLQEYQGRGLLKDKAILITGGDSGIGRAVAILMAREGADISINYLPAEQGDAETTAEAIKAAGRAVQLLPADITVEANCKKLIDDHMSKFKKLDVLVNNAAMQEFTDDATQIDLAVVEKTFRTNILAMIALCKFALPHMKGGGAIVNSASVAGYMGNPNAIDYSSTKGAIVTFTRSLAQQQASRGIRVNAVAPGIIWTPLQPATKGNPADAMKNLGVGTSPKNRPGMPIEVATAYVFLASPLGSFTTGETIHAQGGIEMQG